MDKVKRIIFSIISIAIFITVTCLNITTKDDILFLLITSFSFNILAIFVTENFFTKPTDVIATSFSIILMIFPILLKEKNDIFICLFLIEFIICCALIIISLISLLISNQNKSPETRCNKIAANCKSIACTLGKTKWLYTITYSIFIIRYFNEIEKNPYILLILLIILMIMNNLNLNNIKLSINKKILCSIGAIKSLERDGIVIAELYKDKNIDIKNIVKYIDIDNNKIINYGIVLEKFNDLEKQLIKIINIKTKTLDNNNKLKLGYIYNCNDETNNKEINDIISRIVGIVTSGTSIDTIKFRYININNIYLEEGNLLELKVNNNNDNNKVNNNKVYYQIINAFDNIEKLENDNTLGYIIGEAIQLGKLTEDKMIFEKYGWVPNINTIVCKVKEDILDSNIRKKFLSQNDKLCHIGDIENTNIPIILDLKNSLNYHMAILGVTGTGKTTLVTKILLPEIKKIDKNKIIIFDLTSEYEKIINNYFDIMEKIKYEYKQSTEYPNTSNEIFKDLEELVKIKNKFDNKRTIDESKKMEDINGKIFSVIRKKLKEYFESDNNIAIVKIIEIYNTNTTVDLFAYIFQIIFNEIKNIRNIRITIILEEAHTIVPESNAAAFSSDNKIMQSIINKIGQIALQGRKYNIGLIVISQRTALVSKTILTQCNTIITFKSFDETSRKFISSYLPEYIVNKIGELKEQHAIVYGKAINSLNPIICKIKYIKEETQE